MVSEIAKSGEHDNAIFEHIFLQIIFKIFFSISHSNRLFFKLYLYFPTGISKKRISIIDKLYLKNILFYPLTYIHISAILIVQDQIINGGRKMKTKIYTYEMRARVGTLTLEIFAETSDEAYRRYKKFETKNGGRFISVTCRSTEAEK